MTYQPSVKTYEHTFQMMLDNARKYGELLGAIQVALIDIEYNRPDMAVKVLREAYAKHDVKSEVVS